VRIEGLTHVLPAGSSAIRPGRVRIAFGRPMRLKGEDYAALAQEVEAQVRSL
jgi:hypothetical protein